MGQSSSRVQPFTESEQVYDLPHSKPSKSIPNTEGKHRPHRPDEKPVGDGEEIVLPLSPLKEEKKRNKKKVGHFFQWLSCRLRKKITKSKSSGHGEMKDQGTEAETSGRTDGKLHNRVMRFLNSNSLSDALYIKKSFPLVTAKFEYLRELSCPMVIRKYLL